jgi:hypothetical protein
MFSSVKNDRDFDRMIDLKCHRMESHIYRTFKDQLRLDLEKSGLGLATGITDEHLIGKFHTLGLRDDNLAAFLFLPVAMAGWADGTMTREEAEIASNAFQSLEPPPSQEATRLFSSWLEKKPSHELMDHWELWVEQLLEQVDPESLSEFLRAIASVTKRVASASGGFLGIGKISAGEWAVLERVDRFLNRVSF